MNKQTIKCTLFVLLLLTDLTIRLQRLCVCVGDYLNANKLLADTASVIESIKSLAENEE